MNAKEDPPGALAAARAQRSVLAELSARFPGDVDLESARIGALRQEGSVLSDQDEFTAARGVLEEAVAAGEKLVAAQPRRAFRRNQALAENSLGNALHGEKDYENALLHYQRSLALRVALAEEDPLDADAAWLVLAAHSERIECLEHLERYDEALAGVDAVHAAGEKQAARDPNDATVATRLATFESNVADVFAERARATKHPDDLVSARRWISFAQKRLEALAAAGRLADRSQLEDVLEQARDLQAGP